MQDRAAVVQQNFLERVLAGNLPAPLSPVTLAESGIDGPGLVALFESQCLSRHLDFESRRLQARGEGFYTIGSAGHEGNAAIAAAFRVDDMAFLHYRDAAFLIQRSKQLPGQTPVWDMLLSFVASAEDPISGGRHKVLGSKPLSVPPQTSTIASHLPKAMGAAFSLGLAKRLDHRGLLPEDSVIICSFGDASLNHSTAQGAINAACWSAYQGAAMPLVLICEDNGIGISTPTPGGWVKASVEARPGLRTFACDGLSLLDTYRTARAVERYVRQTRKPAFLHMTCVRLFGHAGSDVQNAYMSSKAITSAEDNDPLLHSARLLIENQVLTAEQVLDLYQDIGERVSRVAEQVITRPKLRNAAEVKASLIPPKRDLPPPPAVAEERRRRLFERDLRNMAEPQHMARLINWALTDLMAEQPNIVLAGEDIGPKGGVYNVTAKLSERVRPGAGDQQPARRAVDPGACHWLGPQRLPADT